jgi:hypothetical protein
MKKNNQGRSTGEMISSIAFFGFGLWLCFEARNQTGLVSDFRIWGLYSTAVFCLLGGLRFVIADIVASLLKSFRK